MEGQAQGVNRRGEQFGGNAFQQHGGALIARDNIPLAVNDKGRVGAVAGEQPVNSRRGKAARALRVVGASTGQRLPEGPSAG